MNLRFAAVVIAVLFVGVPSLESIGTRAQQSACERACVAAADPFNAQLIRELIEEGNDLCNCFCRGTNGGGILHEAARGGCDVCFDLLTNNPGNCTCDDRDFAGNTPLHIAASICNIPNTNRAITAGCDVNAVNLRGNTPLCRAVRNVSDSCGGVAQDLIGAGAQSCRLCKDGLTSCERCVSDNTCNVLEQQGACDC